MFSESQIAHYFDIVWERKEIFLSLMQWKSLQKVNKIQMVLPEIGFKAPCLDQVKVISNEHQAEVIASQILSTEVIYCGFGCESYGRKIGRRVNSWTVLSFEQV